MSDGKVSDFDLKTAQKALDDLTEPYSKQVTGVLSELQIELIADHFAIPAEAIYKLLEYDFKEKC